MILGAINWGVVGTVLAVIAVILLIFLVVLYFMGRKMQQQQNEQAPMIEANTQSVSILPIDKKKLSLKEAVAAGLPEQVMTQTPFYLKFQKVPVVKAKIGPRFMTLISDPAVYEQLPLKKECKVSVSGLYIRSIQSVRGGQIEQLPKKKPGLFGKAAQKAQEVIKKDQASQKAKK